MIKIQRLRLVLALVFLVAISVFFTSCLLLVRGDGRGNGRGNGGGHDREQNRDRHHREGRGERAYLSLPANQPRLTTLTDSGI